TVRWYRDLTGIGRRPYCRAGGIGRWSGLKALLTGDDLVERIGMRRPHLHVVVVIAVNQQAGLLIVVTRIECDLRLNHVVAGRLVLDHQVLGIIRAFVEVTVDSDGEIAVPG